MKRFLRILHRYLYLTIVILLFLLTAPFLYYYARKPQKYYNKISAIRKFISMASLRIAGIRLRITYHKPIDWSDNYVICPNHTSILDIAIISSLSQKPASFLGKIELLQNPLTRAFFKTIDIPVDRKNRISSFKAFQQAKELLQTGKSIIIFPEGKIDDLYPPILHPFKKGAFKLAHTNRIKILPVVIQDAWKLLWDDGAKYGSKPGTIHVDVLAPVEIDIEDKQTELEATVYNMMKESWSLYNKV